MPNHVHVLIKQKQGFPLGELGQELEALHRPRSQHHPWSHGGDSGCRSTTTGGFGDEAHLNRAIVYIENNPVKAGLCRRPEDWEWSSAAEMEAQ